LNTITERCTGEKSCKLIIEFKSALFGQTDSFGSSLT